MILAGDIGGTKTNLGLFEVKDGKLQPHLQRSFPSKDYVGLEAILTAFMQQAQQSPEAACFGIAGPVVGGQCITSNLPWIVTADKLASTLQLKEVMLLNDLEATAYGVFELKPEEMVTLNQGVAAQGNAGVIAAGTGLGEACLFWDGQRYIPSASEGGHVDFAPRNSLEIELLRYLLKQYDHVSVERLLSGPGLLNIYNFLRDSGYGQQTPTVVARFATQDPSSAISAAALSGECQLCLKALNIFTQIYGATAGNIALFLKAVGGIYVGGGIAPKIIEKLKDGTFMAAFTDKGRFSSLMGSIPVRVIMNDKTALLGAARVAANRLNKG